MLPSQFKRYTDESEPLVIDPQVADKIGLNESIVIRQLHFWLKINEKSKKTTYNNKVWCYNTIKEWQENNFKFWSESTIKRIFVNLKELKLIEIMKNPKNSWDKTNWYTIDYINYAKMFENSEKVGELMDEVNLTPPIGSNWSDRSGQNEPAITENTTENTTENKKIYKKEKNEEEKEQSNTPTETQHKSFKQSFFLTDQRFLRLKEIVVGELQYYNPMNEQNFNKTFNKTLNPFFNQLISEGVDTESRQGVVLNDNEFIDFINFILDKKVHLKDFRKWCFKKQTYIFYLENFLNLRSLQDAELEKLRQEGLEFQQKLAEKEILEKQEASKTEQDRINDQLEKEKRKEELRNFKIQVREEMLKKQKTNRKREQEEQERQAREYQEVQEKVLKQIEINKKIDKEMQEWIATQTEPNQTIEKTKELYMEGLKIYFPERYKELTGDGPKPTFNIKKLPVLQKNNLTFKTYVYN